MKSHPPLLSVYTADGEKGRGVIYNEKWSREVPAREAFKQRLDGHVREAIPASEKHG